MKAVFMACNQSMYDAVMDIMNDMELRGFTGWEELMGAGEKDGEPHLGSHAWPSLASAIITFVDDSRVEYVLNALHQMDIETPKLGLRAFVWDVEKNI